LQCKALRGRWGGKEVDENSEYKCGQTMDHRWSSEAGTSIIMGPQKIGWLFID
jgi:hypothetical protein